MNVSKFCVCGVCEFGSDDTEVPKNFDWLTDIFCNVGSQEVCTDGITRSIPAYVWPFFSNYAEPLACPKMQAHIKLMASRLSEPKAA
jgi:hypothetical protein